MMNKTLFAYLNINHPMVAWEVAIGRIRSACDLDLGQQSFGISLWQYNLLRKYSGEGLSKRFENELLLESVRQKNFHSSVPRLRGVYFFESERDAHAAVERWGVPGNRRFITAVNFSASKTTHVDSEWITSYLNTDENDWMNRYWRGETLGESPLTEVLASGIGIVQNMNLRQEAYAQIMKLFPNSTPLLAMACCSFKHARLESIAQVVPGIIRDKSGIEVSFHIYMGDLDHRQVEIQNALSVCKARNEMPPMIQPSDPNVFFNLPDLMKDRFRLDDTRVVKLCGEVHESIRGW